MPRRKDPVFAERDARIVAEFEKDPENIKLTHLARSFGITYTNCHRILKASGVFDPSKRNSLNRAGRQRFSEKRPVSTLHYQGVGQRIWRYRNAQEGRGEISRPEFAARLQMSTVRLHQIEIGIAPDLTLSEIQRIAECIGMTVSQMLDVEPGVLSATPSVSSNSHRSGGGSAATRTTMRWV